MWDFKLKSFLDDLKNHADRRLVTQKSCDVPGCEGLGEHRAPKSRDALQSYFWFCLDHVRDYNAKWDFFKGMSSGEIENHMYRATVWDRPTWRTSKTGGFEEAPRRKIYEHFSGEGVSGRFSMGGEAEDDEQAHINISALPHPTIEALATMNLAPPIEWEDVKARYKILAKKHHPDTNKGNKTAEEQFKKISLAYAILKLSYETYKDLEQRS